MQEISVIAVLNAVIAGGATRELRNTDASQIHANDSGNIRGELSVGAILRKAQKKSTVRTTLEIRDFTVSPFGAFLENMMNKDQVKGRLKRMVGKVQEKAGKAVGSRKQQAKGLSKQISGKLQKDFGDLRNASK